MRAKRKSTDVKKTKKEFERQFVKLLAIKKSYFSLLLLAGIQSLAKDTYFIQTWKPFQIEIIGEVKMMFLDYEPKLFAFSSIFLISIFLFFFLLIWPILQTKKIVIYDSNYELHGQGNLKFKEKLGDTLEKMVFNSVFIRVDAL